MCVSSGCDVCDKWISLMCVSSMSQMGINNVCVCHVFVTDVCAKCISLMCVCQVCHRCMCQVCH